MACGLGPSSLGMVSIILLNSRIFHLKGGGGQEGISKKRDFDPPHPPVSGGFPLMWESYHNIKILQYHIITILQYHNKTILPYQNFDILHYHNITILHYYKITILQYQNITILKYQNKII